MEIEPKSEIGKRLLTIVKSWTQETTESVMMDKIKRVLIFHSPGIKNGEEFISFLYGQSALEEWPLTLSQQLPTTLQRLQHVIGASLEKSCVKELVVALESSGNEKVLSEILGWAEKCMHKDESKVLSVDLAPQRVHNRKLFSAITPESLPPRHRKINWMDEQKFSTVLEVCRKKIIVGFNTGMIEIFSSDDLHCLTVLTYHHKKASVICLQCTGTEIIAGYGDGNISIWNVERATVLHNLHIRIGNDVQNEDYPCSMKLKNARLVIGSGMGRVKIWHYVSSSVTLLKTWNVVDGGPLELDCNENYLIVRPFRTNPVTILVQLFNGQEHRSITVEHGIASMALYADYLVTGGNDKIVRLWDVRTGAHLRELRAHEGFIATVDLQSDVFVTADQGGRIIIWNLRAALAGGQAEITSFSRSGSLKVVIIKLGSNFLVSSCLSPLNSIEVTDFA